MKQKILQMLKTKFAHLGLSEAILNGYAEILATQVTEESQIETAVNGVESSLKAIQSDSDKSRTETNNLKKQIADLQKAIDAAKGGSEEGEDEDDEEEPEQKPAKKPKSKSNPNKELMQMLQDMRKELADLKTDKTKANNATILAKKLEEKKIPEWFSKHAVSGRDFADEAAITAFVDDLDRSYQETSKTLKIENLKTNVVPANGSQGSTDNKISEDMANYVASKKADADKKKAS